MSLMVQETEQVWRPVYRPIESNPKPVVFPSAEKRMESKLHRLVCNLIYELLRVVFGDRALLGLDQFLYWDASDPRQKAAPDVFGRLGEPDRFFPSWKVWELAAPTFVFEVVSDASWPDDVTHKPTAYASLGVQELIVFDPEWEARSPAGGKSPRLLRAWRRIEGAFVEVEVEPEPDRYFAETLGLWVRVLADGQGRLWLRLGRGSRGEELVPTPEARARAEGQAHGEAKGKAEAILTVLESRGIPVPEPIRARIRACDDVSTLDRWLARATSVGSAADVVVAPSGPET